MKIQLQEKHIELLKNDRSMDVITSLIDSDRILKSDSILTSSNYNREETSERHYNNYLEEGDTLKKFIGLSNTYDNKLHFYIVGEVHIDNRTLVIIFNGKYFSLKKEDVDKALIKLEG